VRVLATPEVIEFVRARGGVLFVWAERLASARGVGYLEASTDSPGAERSFRRFTGEGFDLLFDTGEVGLPEELHLDVKGWLTKRPRAYWNGNSYIQPRPDPR
jgi:hypothetical protein